MIRSLWYGLFVVGFVLAGQALRAADNVIDLISGLRPVASVVSGRESRFLLEGRAEVPIDGRSQSIQLRLVRFDNDSFDLDLSHPEYAVTLRRRSDVTVLALPKHGTAFVGRGAVASEDALAPEGIVARLISRDSDLMPVNLYLMLLRDGEIDSIIRSLAELLKIDVQSENGVWKKDDVELCFPEAGKVEIKGKDSFLQLTVSTATPEALDPLAGLTAQELDRAELERTFVRGIRRATEILQPGLTLTRPEQAPRTVEHGTLRWIDGQRVATLWGTPEEIGEAHGKLLPRESQRCIESVLYTFGTANVVRTGRWFRHDLMDAYARLAPHIPERHKRETRALAASLKLDPQTVEVLNVFPELFHCSGFAVFGSATADGKLYHGRVLDYMTTIGLQDAATTFIVRPEGHIAFANVGYAAFIGSVSGMNAEKISLGEMGGRGEGLWDGAPMATLMRRALEECDTLKEVQDLWANSPRTCEYYYVFADGEVNDAVGVAATPESVEFIAAGEGHERLGDGIQDAVVLSAGSRLQELRKRVTEQHGKINAEIGQWLMSRPVAMNSNLHNVLFVPADGVMYVANASHHKPAAEMPYVCIDLLKLLSEIP